MFTFLIQAIDLIELNQVGFFLTFFVLSWSIHLIKIIVSTRDPLRGIKRSGQLKSTVTAIVPVVNEPMDVWVETMDGLEKAMSQFGSNSQVIIVANGKNGVENLEYASAKGFEVIRLLKASKRNAIYQAVKKATGKYTVILDSDTFVYPDSIYNLLKVFSDPNVGGVTPKHVITGRKTNTMRRISDWLEDIRFEEILRGQSSFGSVSCLPGRLLAVRTELLKDIVPGLINQKFLGRKCISGDDRYITSEILK